MKKGNSNIMGKLDGKLALITGATSGMGKAFAELFAKEGAEIIIVGRNSERGEKCCTNILTNGGKARFIKCDVTIEKEVIKLKEEFLKHYNKLDILLNNAGLLITEYVEEIQEENWKKVFDSNTNSVMYMTKHFIEFVLAAHGNILNNASIDGLQSCVRGRACYAYAASKAATIQFTQTCALNYSDRIRVNALCPGVTKTPFFTNQDFSRFIGAIPMGRVAEPEEIAKAALFLVSDDASYVSGAILKVDGAASLK